MSFVKIGSAEFYEMEDDAQWDHVAACHAEIDRLTIDRDAAGEAMFGMHQELDRLKAENSKALGELEGIIVQLRQRAKSAESSAITLLDKIDRLKSSPQSGEIEAKERVVKAAIEWLDTDNRICTDKELAEADVKLCRAVEALRLNAQEGGKCKWCDGEGITPEGAFKGSGERCQVCHGTGKAKGAE